MTNTRDTLRDALSRRHAVFLAAFGFCGGLAVLLVLGGIQHRAAEAASAATPAIEIDNYSFSPGALTVPVGTTVTWTNKDEVPHTIVSADNPRLFRSGGLDTDDKFAFKFTRAGTYKYFCSVHPYMTGEIVVR
jgi:plastocyanin